MDKLLKILISDQKNTADIYKPGPYWWKKSLVAAKELEKNGLNDLRSSMGNNIAATAFGENMPVDSRRLIGTSSLQIKVGLAILNHTPLKQLFDWQVNTTRKYLNRLRNLEKTYLALTKSDRLAELTQKYKIEDSINFGCDRISIFKGQNYSTYYLGLLDQLDFVENNLTLKGCHSFLEIGPGFGANIHLIEQNYPEIRKFIVIDIVPNVWIVTNYLRSLYGDCVKDYLVTREMKEIKFKEDKSLEIFVIPAWEIGKISSSIDCFWNSRSFVEMPQHVVSNYAKNLAKIRTDKTIYNFMSYDNFDLKTTFNPNLIPDHFLDVEFQKLKHPYLLDDLDDRYEMYFYLGKLKSKL
jgi:putative sugar O-methyltransferase